MIADCSVLVVKFLFLQGFIIWDSRWQSCVNTVAKKSALDNNFGRHQQIWKVSHILLTVIIDVILSQGKQLNYNYEFHPFCLEIAHFGGRGGVWKRLPGWFWANLYMIIFLKDMRPKMGQIKNYIFLREKYIPFKHFFNGICWSWEEKHHHKRNLHQSGK